MKKYSCIDKLIKLLEESNIPYYVRNLFDGRQVIIGDPTTDILCDAVCHSYSKGSDKNLLEIMNGMTEDELKADFVKGNLTPNEVLKRFSYCYNNHTKTYKEEDEI